MTIISSRGGAVGMRLGNPGSDVSKSTLPCDGFLLLSKATPTNPVKEGSPRRYHLFKAPDDHALIPSHRPSDPLSLPSSLALLFHRSPGCQCGGIGGVAVFRCDRITYHLDGVLLSVSWCRERCRCLRDVRFAFRSAECASKFLAFPRPVARALWSGLGFIAT